MATDAAWLWLFPKAELQEFSGDETSGQTAHADEGAVEVILKKGAFGDFARRVKAGNKRVIVYGAGVIGEAAAPYWLHEYGLDMNVLCYVDADAHKHGKTIQIGSCAVPVASPAVLKELRGDCVILITVSAFESVVRALEQIDELRNIEAYFLPVMLLDAAHAPKKIGVMQSSSQPLIPKKIHYCWFSGNPIPAPLQGCIDTWKRACPDYEIIRWDESNYDVEKTLYTKQAYERRRWGYIPDVAKLVILHRCGGIYLDTDVELLRSLDPLLYQPAFCGVEKWGIVNMGVSGAQPGNPVLQAMLDDREDKLFLYADGSENRISSGLYDTLPLLQKGMRPNGETQLIAGGQMTVYAAEFFQPFDYMSGETHVTQNTFAIHHFSGTWLGREAALEREKTRQKFGEFLARLE